MHNAGVADQPGIFVDGVQGSAVVVEWFFSSFPSLLMPLERWPTSNPYHLAPFFGRQHAVTSYDGHCFAIRMLRF